MTSPPVTDPASMPVSQALETTGVPQLDLVLGGGLPVEAVLLKPFDPIQLERMIRRLLEQQYLYLR